MTLINPRRSAVRLSDRIIETVWYAGPLLGGTLAWYMAWYLPAPRWWATR